MQSRFIIPQLLNSRLQIALPPRNEEEGSCKFSDILLLNCKPVRLMEYEKVPCEVTLDVMRSYLKSNRNFLESYLAGAIFFDAVLNEANFSFSNLYHARFPHSRLERADFACCCLTKATFAFAIANQASFREAKLLLASFRGAKLKEADFWKADLRCTDISEADLEEAQLQEANLIDACLDKTNLRGANLTGATVSWSALASSKLGDTVMPDGRRLAADHRFRLYLHQCWRLIRDHYVWCPVFVVCLYVAVALRVSSDTFAVVGALGHLYVLWFLASAGIWLGSWFLERCVGLKVSDLEPTPCNSMVIVLSSILSFGEALESTAGVENFFSILTPEESFSYNAILIGLLTHILALTLLKKR